MLYTYSIRYVYETKQNNDEISTTYIITYDFVTYIYIYKHIHVCVCI